MTSIAIPKTDEQTAALGQLIADAHGWTFSGNASLHFSHVDNEWTVPDEAFFEAIEERLARQLDDDESLVPGPIEQLMTYDLALPDNSGGQAVFVIAYAGQLWTGERSIPANCDSAYQAYVELEVVEDTPANRHRLTTRYGREISKFAEPVINALAAASPQVLRELLTKAVAKLPADERAVAREAIGLTPPANYDASASLGR